MLSKIRRIKTIESDEIILKIFEKIEHKIISRSKDINKLGRIFLRATLNEDELYVFLTNTDMSVSELEQRTLQSGFALLLEDIIAKITQKRKDGVAFTKSEKMYVGQLATLLKKAI
jgi:hypothetical protein